MYDLSRKFNTFYRTKVVLSKEDKQSLINKKNLNVKRLKEGLKEYNDEKKTNHKLAEEPIIQGSVAMSTVVQNEDNDYDIDVAIIFDKTNLPDGTTSTKKMVENALRRKCTGFKTPPEAKTNCVRVIYNENYHVDFAIYRRYRDEEGDYKYEHCGSEWRERDPRAITKWFVDQDKEKEYKLRAIVRLMKMFSKSKLGWRMPAGLIQSVLADEKFQSYERIDERFYYTMVAIRDRLADDKEVYNPTDSTKSLKLVSADNEKINNLYTRLDKELSKLGVLFESGCSYNQAIEAWEGFFNHSYWTDQKQDERAQLTKSVYSQLNESQVYNEYRETEEYISNIFPVNLIYELDLNCTVSRNEKKIGSLTTLLQQGQLLFPGQNLDFYAKTNTPEPYEVYWKVKNSGDVAKEKDCVRGQIMNTNLLHHHEETLFKGNHYVECYIVKNGECVARKKIPVPIRVS